MCKLLSSSALLITHRYYRIVSLGKTLLGRCFYRKYRRGTHDDRVYKYKLHNNILNRAATCRTKYQFGSQIGQCLSS